MRHTTPKIIFPGLIALVLLTPVFAANVPQDQLIRPEGTTAATGDRAELVKYGEQLWHDPALSKKGKTACASCHKGNTRMFKKTFLEAYPHYVKMADKKANLEQITTEGMIQFCMLVPMKNDILPWDSKELTALSAYTEDVVQKAYIEYIDKKKKKK